MHHASDILLTIFIIFIAAQIGAEVAQRLKMPGVVGEIAAGCAVGPSLLGWLTPEQILPGTVWCCCCFRWGSKHVWTI
jgi:Kef-type K+ transport system membrane component KefB